MKLLNFERKNLRIEGEKAWCYVRGTDAERERRIYVRKNFDDDAPYCSNLTKEEEEEEERRRSEEERRRRELHVVTGGREG